MNNSFDFTDDFIEVQEIMKTNLPEPTLLEYYRALNNREIIWNDDIGDNMMEVPLHILKWNREDKGIPIEDRKPIRFWINSDGGDLNITMFTANMIALSKTPVITIGMGCAYSSGGLLLMSGHKRLVFESTSVLIHDGSTGAIGDTSKVIDNLEFTKQFKVRMKEFILSHTNISEDLLDKNYHRDWFLFSEDVIKYGLADKIITDISEIL